MTNADKMIYRNVLKETIRLDYNMMKETWNIEVLEYLEGHAKGFLSAYNLIGVIPYKIRLKYDAFIEAVYNSRRAVIK